MRSIRGGMGLGDALYVQAVARHFASKGESLKIATAYPEVFKPLNGHASTMPFTRAGINLLAHYTARKGMGGTTQFQDVCLSAGLKEPIPLCLDWAIQNEALVTDVRARAAGKPIVLIQLMRPPMNRKDKFGASLLPRASAIQRCLDRLRGKAFLVQVGSGKRLHELSGIDLDLADKTSLTDLLDLASVADRFLGYVSFFVPLAESLEKRALFVWSSRGLCDPIAYVRQITPEKIIHRKDLCKWVIDDDAPAKIEEAADALLL